MDKPTGYSTLLRNLRFSTTPQVVREAFERFGKIRDVYLPLDFNTKRPRGFGFVEYYEKSDAIDAVKAMDNTELDGSVITCCLAQDRRKSPSSMRRFYRNRMRRTYRSRSDSYGRRSRSPPRFRDDRRRDYSLDRSPRRMDRHDYRGGYRDRYDPGYDRDGRRMREPYDRDYRDRGRGYRGGYRDPDPRARDVRDKYRDEPPHYRPTHYRDDKYREPPKYRDDKFKEDNFRDEFPEDRYEFQEPDVDMDKEKPEVKNDVDSFRDFSRSRSASPPNH